MEAGFILKKTITFFIEPPGMIQPLTSASHMPRPLRLFERQGLHPIPVPTDFHRSADVHYWQAPTRHALSTSTLAIHEYLGMAWEKIKTLPELVR